MFTTNENIIEKIKTLDTTKKIKIAFTGTHGVGKTTSVYGLAHDLKLLINNKTIHTLMENAKESPYKINKETSKNSQMWIFSNQMSNELRLTSLYDIVITDRTIVDPLAYSKYMKYDDLVNSLYSFAFYYIDTYDLIIYKTMKKNNFQFNDGNRDSKDLQFRADVDFHLYNFYNSFSSKNDKLKSNFILD